MQFTPDTRNMGGRSLILQQLWGHRVCLQNIKERPPALDFKSPSLKKVESNPLNVQHERNLVIHRKKLNEIQECLTERNSKPAYFFRRLPSPKLLTKKSKSTQEKPKQVVPPPDIDLQSILTRVSEVDWQGLVQSLRGVNYPLKRWIKNLAYSFKISDDNDFATLIRILVQGYKLKQSILVNIVAEIIEELER